MKRILSVINEAVAVVALGGVVLIGFGATVAAVVGLISKGEWEWLAWMFGWPLLVPVAIAVIGVALGMVAWLILLFVPKRFGFGESKSFWAMPWNDIAKPALEFLAGYFVWLMNKVLSLGYALQRLAMKPKQK